MNSKHKGNIGELKVATELVALGHSVSFPFGDNERYDLILDLRGDLKKVQIKYIDTKSNENSYYCPCVSSTNHTTNKKLSDYSNDVDYIAFYINDIQKCCIMSMQEINNRKGVTFRESLPKNNQKKNINLISDYSLDKI